MNLLNQMMSYDKTKNENQEQCNCAECVGNAEISEKREIVGNFKYADNFLIKVENYRLMCRERKILNTMNLDYWYKDLKTKNFIWKSLCVHGNRYDYSNVFYIKATSKVEIICRIKNHKSFPQTPDAHLHGQGCKLCKNEKLSNDRKLTREEFIRRAKIIHNNKYDYSFVDYKGMNELVKIICPIHGEFFQTPNHHLIGCDCKQCGIEKQINKLRMSLKEFIQKAKRIHSDKYDYSLVEYNGWNKEILIICAKHGIFRQTPNNHLQGQGCKLCRSSKGEITIRNWLIKNKIEFEEQKRFKNCKYKKQLSFDFYIPKYNLCIEFDGKQHFIPHDFSSKGTDKQKIENLKIVQLRDQIKNDYCKSNGINLLRIRYDENIEEKLTECFQNYRTNYF